MNEYVPIDIDDVVHVTAKAMLVRIFRFFEDYDEEEDLLTEGIDIVEWWIPLEHLEQRRCDAGVPCTIKVLRWWAEQEGLCDDYQ